MELKVQKEKNTIRIVSEKNEETFFNLLKDSLENNPKVDIVGVSKEHPLLEETQFVVRTKKEDCLKVLKEEIASLRKKISDLKIK